MRPASIEALARAAFRSGRIDPALQRYAADQIRRRGLQPAIDAAEAQIARAFGERRAASGTEGTT